MIWLYQSFFRSVLSNSPALIRFAVGCSLAGLLACFPLVLTAQTTAPNCPVIGPVENLTICGERPLTITICVTSTVETEIELAVFAESVSDPYSQSALMVGDLGYGNVQSGTACITPTTPHIPENTGTTPIEYFLYACLKPDPEDPACFATSYSVAKLTVLPAGCGCPPARCVPILVQKITKK